mmetsp:Transcript_57961/g.164689  ORF Transcript_57961/g.164689 Transcript_57961/m.164689 type:complete len:338 (+) Transcript_57961:501-1514(+)
MVFPTRRAAASSVGCSTHRLSNAGRIPRRTLPTETIHAVGSRTWHAAAARLRVILQPQLLSRSRPPPGPGPGLAIVLVAGPQGDLLLAAAAPGGPPRAVHFVAIVAVRVGWHVGQEDLARGVPREDAVRISALLIALLLQHAVLALGDRGPAGSVCACLAEIASKIPLLPVEPGLLLQGLGWQVAGPSRNDPEDLCLGAAVLALLDPELAAAPLQLSCKASHLAVHGQQAPAGVLHLRAQHVDRWALGPSDQAPLRPRWRRLRWRLWRQLRHQVLGLVRHRVRLRGGVYAWPPRAHLTAGNQLLHLLRWQLQRLVPGGHLVDQPTDLALDLSEVSCC